MSDKGWDLGAYLREQREHARLSVRQLANLAGVSNPYLSQVERGLRKPSAEVLQQIARGLRISAEALYVRAGILDSEGRPDVEAAVNSDPELNDRQRRVLLDIYASFRAENRRAAEPEGPEPAPRRRPTARVRSAAKTAKSATRSATGRAARSAARTAAAAAAAAAPTDPASTGPVPTGPVPTGRVPTRSAAPSGAEVPVAAPADAPAARRAPRKRAAKRATTRATTRSVKATRPVAAAGSESTASDPGAAPDAHL